MLRCILIDDELPSLGYLQALCRDRADLEVVRSFNDPLKFLDQLDTLDFDLCILDINMPRINGLEVATKLAGKAVIFTTAYKEYAADAFDLDAVDYIRKPYQAERLDQAIDKAVKWMDRQSPDPTAFFELNTHIGKTKVDERSIAYIVVAEYDRRDKKLQVHDGSTLFAKNITFDELQHLLPKDRFCRINRGTIIQLQTVKSYTQQQICCRIDSQNDLLTFTLSEQYRSEFIALWETQYKK